MLSEEEKQAACDAYAKAVMDRVGKPDVRQCVYAAVEAAFEVREKKECHNAETHIE